MLMIMTMMNSDNVPRCHDNMKRISSALLAADKLQLKRWAGPLEARTLRNKQSNARHKRCTSTRTSTTTSTTIAATTTTTAATTTTSTATTSNMILYFLCPPRPFGIHPTCQSGNAGVSVGSRSYATGRLFCLRYCSGTTGLLRGMYCSTLPSWRDFRITQEERR